MSELAGQMFIAKTLFDARIQRDNRAGLNDYITPAIHLITLDIKGLRDRLLGRVSGGIENINIFSPELAAKEIIQYAESLKDASQEERAVASKYIEIIRRKVVEIQYRTGIHSSAHADIDIALRGLQVSGKDVLEAGKSLMAGYVKEGGAASYIAENVSHLPEKEQQFRLDRKKRSDKARIDYENARYEENSAKVALEALTMKYVGELSRADIYKLPEHKEIADRYWKLKDLTEIARKAYYAPDEFVDKEIIQEYAREGQALIDQMLSESSISEVEATKWADAVPIQKAAKAKLEKMGYPIPKFRKDMAEFYRLSNGRMGNVGISTTRGRRANASGITSELAGSVNISSSFDKRTLFHELAHHLEADPAAMMVSTAFLLTRRTNDKPKSLRSITGNSGYRSNEVAYEDSFINPYVGKVYSDGISEVYSMGMESFSDPETLARDCAKDPQHFAMMIGFVKSKAHPAYKVVRGIYEDSNKANEEYTETVTETMDGILKEIAKYYPLENQPEDEKLRFDTWVKSRYRLKKYIGKIRDWYIYTCSTKDWQTKRMVSGFYAIKIVDGRHTFQTLQSKDVNLASAYVASEYVNYTLNATVTGLKNLLKAIENANQ